MKRVLPYILFFFCVGIYLADKVQCVGAVCAGVALAAAFCALTTKRVFAAFFPLAVLFGMFVTLAHGGDKTVDALLDNAAAAKQDVAADCTVVSSSPRVDGCAYVLKTESILLEDGTEITKPCGIRLITPQKFDCGDKLCITARIYAHNGKFNPSDFDNKLYLKIHGCSHSFYIDEPADTSVTVKGRQRGFCFWVKNLMYGVRDRVNSVFDKSFDSEKAAVLKAVATGDKSGLDGDISDDFRNAGVYHFLAISGLHISVLAGLMLFLLGRANKNAACVITLVFLALYWLMTGGSVSVTRAALMIYILIFGRMLNKSYDITNSVSLAALVLLVINPLFLYDTGFLYSFGAVFGIALAVGAAAKIKRHRKLVTAAAAAFGAVLVPRIITLLCFYTVNPFEILTNLLLMPLMSLIVIGAFAVGFAGLILTDVGLIAKPLSLAVGLLMRITRLLAPVSAINVGYPSRAVLCLVLAATLLTVLFLLRPSRRRFACALVCVPLIFAAHALTRDKAVNINFLYVGQGDSCVITHEDRAYIIDCGGSGVSDIGKDTGRYRIMPFLAYSGIKSAEAVFISHNDTDHIKGLFDMLGNVDIKTVYISDKCDKNENYDMLMQLADKYGVPVRTLGVGESLTFDGLRFDCLFPYEHNEKSGNDNSMVLKLTHGKNTVLFAGDISKKSEKLLLEADVDADVLKIAHHGSKNSSDDDFIDAVSPRLAVASAGKNNQYSLPSRDTLQRFAARGIPVYVTCNGMVKLKSNGNDFDIYIAE